MAKKAGLHHKRLPTGIPGLDTVLQGGFLRGGLYIIMGAPGAGKTILGNQICFHHVASGGKAVYITLLAETHTKMLAHIENLSFFDINPIAESLRYISGYSILEEEGLDGFLKFLRQTIQQNPSLLVIDGTATLEEMETSGLILKRFFHELQAYTEMTHCTILLLTHSPYEAYGHPEHTMVDGLIELRDTSVGLRAVRELEIRKLRGTGFLRGTHFFKITDDGIIVYPRIEALLSTPTATVGEETEGRQARFNVPELDQMLGNGLSSPSVTLIFGPAGSGKTMFGLQFVAAGAESGEPGLIFGFYERPAQLVQKARSAGIPYDRYVADGLIEILWDSAVEDLLDVLAHRLLEAIHRRQVRRLFIDGLDAFRQTAIYAERLPQVMTALMNELRALNITTIVSSEMRELISPSIQEPIEGLSATVDNIIYLRPFELQSRLYRLISVLKMRSRAYDTSIRKFEISERGIDVSTTFEGVAQLLDGDAQVQKPD